MALSHILGRLSSKSTERTKKILVKTTCIVYHELKNDKNPKSERKKLNTNIRLWFSHEIVLGNAILSDGQLINEIILNQFSDDHYRQEKKD